jgi:hypothetical protein
VARGNRRGCHTEQANWWPPGTANSIGASYLHVVINADIEVNRLIFGREPLAEERWGGDVGQGFTHDPDRFDRWVRHAEVDWERLRDYGSTVHAGLVKSLGELRPEHLDMDVDMTRSGLGMWDGRELLCLHGIEHVRIHGGEIACVEGLQGGVGWTESDAFRTAISVEEVSEQ